MSAITVWNKGKRTWDITNVEGEKVRLAPNESAEMEEVDGLRLIANYSRDLTTSKTSGPNAADLKRREQSIHDKELHLKEREAALDEREKAIKEADKVKPTTIAEAVEIIAPFLSDIGSAYLAETSEAWKSQGPKKRGPGRPAKAKDEPEEPNEK